MHILMNVKCVCIYVKSNMYLVPTCIMSMCNCASYSLEYRLSPSDRVLILCNEQNACNSYASIFWRKPGKPCVFVFIWELSSLVKLMNVIGPRGAERQIDQNGVASRRKFEWKPTAQKRCRPFFYAYISQQNNTVNNFFPTRKGCCKLSNVLHGNYRN